jgi:hypothetical protein
VDEVSIGSAMGHLELFAQRTFAEETEHITKGAAGWQDPSEIRLEKVRPMGSAAPAARVGAGHARLFADVDPHS